jgi:hypothetical protein
MSALHILIFTHGSSDGDKECGDDDDFSSQFIGQD